MPRGPFLKTGRTPKQELGLQKTVEYNGNGVQAAREIYDCNDHSAYGISSENWNHPRIRLDLEKAFLARGATPDKLAGTVAEALNARRDDEADHAIRLTAVRVAVKVLEPQPQGDEHRKSRIEMVLKVPIEVKCFVADHGRWPTAAERAMLLNSAPEGDTKDPETAP